MINRALGRALARARSLAGVTTMAVLPAFAASAQQGSITGRVTATVGGAPLADARVFLVGTTLAASSNADGQYTLRGVPPGTAEVRVIRVGYGEQKKPVVVATGQPTKLDFSLEIAVVQLQEVVTTATGEQRKVELGNTVAVIEATKRVEETPIHNMGDLLVAKAPGVSVLPGNMTGAAPNIRIRGLNSISRSNAPIFIIDGIRMDAGSGSLSVGGTTSSRLNDLTPEEVENIEIVKGPSAATLYGTDAANGVIVITTKHGRPGNTRWTWTGEGGQVLDKNEYPHTYAIWGHTPSAPNTQVRCYVNTLADGSCIKDSLTSAYMIREPGISPLSTGKRSLYGMQIAGGNDAIRYFLSGNLENERGPVKMPGIDARRLDSLHINVRDEWMYPEKLQRRSFRANLNAAPSAKLDIALQSAFIQSDQRLPQVDNNVNSFYYNAFTNPGFRHAGLDYTNVGSLGQPLNGWGSYTPAEIFQRNVTESVDRFLGGVTANWRPIAWLQNDATFGVDHQANDNFSLCRLNECADFGTQRLGTISDNHNNQRIFTATVRSTASWQALSSTNVRTTIGADYLNNENEGSTAGGTQLPPGGQTVGSAAVPSSSNVLPSATKTLGYYGQSQVAFRDRVFATLALRYDQNTAFGTKYKGVPYPKASLSWNISDENFFPRLDLLSSLHLRLSYGSSGVQPAATSALRTFASTTVSLVSDQPGLLSSAIGNPNLKPETSTETETGFDARLFRNRVSIEATYYSKQTRDALINLAIGPSSGAAVTQVLKNLGSVKNAGAELAVTAQLLDTRRLGWDVTVGGSHNKNKLVTMGVDDAGNPVPPTGTTTRNQPGYPLNGYWLVPFTYDDANHDGLLSTSEVTVNPKDTVFLGSSQPIDQLSIQSGFDLFKKSLRISVLGDYKGGGVINNDSQRFLCAQTTSCFGLSNPAADLYTQARGIAARFSSTKTNRGYYESGQFWRLREVSATLNIPDRMVHRAINAQSASLTFGARNLKIWTKYTGSGNDPEANYATGDTQSDLLTTAPRRYYTVRLNLHY